jgi:hypothetical protein
VVLTAINNGDINNGTNASGGQSTSGNLQQQAQSQASIAAIFGFSRDFYASRLSGYSGTDPRGSRVGYDS